jgi:hypothetical protein
MARKPAETVKMAVRLKRKEISFDHCRRQVTAAKTANQVKADYLLLTLV